MPATVKATLKPEPRADKTHAVRIRITKERVVRYTNTGVFILRRDWNPKSTYDKENWVRESNREHAHYNRAIRTLMDRAKRLALADPSLDAAQLTALLQGQDAGGADFLAYMQRGVDRAYAEGRIATGDRYQVAVNKLSAFAGGTLPFSRLTLSLVQDYIAHLKAGRGNSNVSVKGEMAILQAFANQAVKERLLGHEANPFPHVSVKGRSARKERLDPDQMQRLNQAEDRLSGAEGDALRLFLVQYHLHGARIGDALQLRWENVLEGRIVFSMGKSDKKKSIRRTPALNRILDYYREPGRRQEVFVFPFLRDKHLLLDRKAYAAKKKYRILKVNTLLKGVAERLGLGLNLTSHVSRHSFASAALRMGVDIYTLSGLLGHTSVTTTQIYANELTEGQLDAVADVIYGDRENVG